MTFFDKLPFIGKEIIVQTLDTFSYALSRHWTISKTPYPVSTDVTSDLMNHMSKLDLSAFGAQTREKQRIITLFECSLAQFARNNM